MFLTLTIFETEPRICCRPEGDDVAQWVPVGNEMQHAEILFPVEMLLTFLSLPSELHSGGHFCESLKEWT